MIDGRGLLANESGRCIGGNRGSTAWSLLTLAPNDITSTRCKIKKNLHVLWMNDSTSLINRDKSKCEASKIGTKKKRVPIKFWDHFEFLDMYTHKLPLRTDMTNEYIASYIADNRPIQSMVFFWSWVVWPLLARLQLISWKQLGLQHRKDLQWCCHTKHWPIRHRHL